MSAAVASSSASAATVSQNAHSDLDQDRSRWFAELEAIKGRFEAEKDNIRSKFIQQQRDACHDLDEEARLAADLPGLPQQARDLIQKYQSELRRHRYASCQHAYDAEESERAKREKDNLRQHHMVFPVPGMPGQNPAYPPGAGLLGRTSSGASGQIQTARDASTSDILGRGPSSMTSNTLPPPRQPQTQTTMMPIQATQPHQALASSRSENTVNSDMSSAPMPSQLNHTNHQTQIWANQNHSGTQQGPPHMPALYNQNRPLNSSAKTPPRMLASHGHLPTLGSNHYGPIRASLGQGPTGPQPVPTDFMRSNRVPLPPMNQSALNAREDRSQPHMARNASHLLPHRHDGLARQAAEIQLERQRKRKSDASEISVRDADLKRARIGSPQSIAPRTILFKDVYQDGKAEYKHNIVKYEDVFYILRCDEHGVHFKQNALAAAAKHLHGASHGHQRKEHKLAVETLGFHVVDCTEELAALNNAFVRRAFENGYKPLNQLHGPKSGGKRHSGGTTFMEPATDRGPPASESPFQTPSQITGAHESEPEQQEAKQQDSKKQDGRPQELTNYIINPKAGELYDAKWPRSSKIYTVMVLGWTDLDMCGWDSKLSSTGLYDKKVRSACYTYNADGIAGWAPGFGDGEARVMERDIPVLWFEPKAQTRLGWLGVKWLLKPMLLDDPDRPADPDHPSNRARKMYAETRGFNSFEAMLARHKHQSPGADEGAESAEEVPKSAQLPSSASASDSGSPPDVDMYDFGDVHHPADDSDDEDYIERSGKDKDMDDDMTDGDRRPTTPQPLRRSTQEVRPVSRLGDSSWSSLRSGAAAGTRSSAKKDKTTAENDDVTMEDVSQGTPSKTRVVDSRTPTPSVQGNAGGLPSVALGTPATPNDSKLDDATTAPVPNSAHRPNGSAATSTASPGPTEPRAERVALSEFSEGNPPQRSNAHEITKAANNNVKVLRESDVSEGKNPLAENISLANLAQGAMKAASKSPSLEKEGPRISPKLQLANLLNNNTSAEKPVEQSSLPASQATKPTEARRPLPSGPLQSSRPSPAPSPMPSKEQQAEKDKAQRPTPTPLKLSPIIPASNHKLDAGQRPSPALSVQSSREVAPALNSPMILPPRSGSAESALRRPDPRMSISNALDDQERGVINQTGLGITIEKDAGPNTSNGISSGNSTPRMPTHVNLVNDERWRAIRTSESPRISPAMIRSPLIDRSAAASPALSVKNLADNPMDVAAFREGDKSWTQPGKFLRFFVEDESSGIARTRKEDGIEVVVDARQVKAAQMVGSTVRLMLKAEDGKPLEQQFVFEANSLTGSHRGARPQATKFYRWVTSKSSAIEHIA